MPYPAYGQAEDPGQIEGSAQQQREPACYRSGGLLSNADEGEGRHGLTELKRTAIMYQIAINELHVLPAGGVLLRRSARHQGTERTTAHASTHNRRPCRCRGGRETLAHSERSGKARPAQRNIHYSEWRGNFHDPGHRHIFAAFYPCTLTNPPVLYKLCFTFSARRKPVPRTKVPQ